MLTSAEPLIGIGNVLAVCSPECQSSMETSILNLKDDFKSKNKYDLETSGNCYHPINPSGVLPIPNLPKETFH
jgi:hypothetical protein